METGVQQSMNDMPLISVIVPVYNGERYLPACIDSILGQTWPCMEIIIVDDGSTDDSGNIAEQYCESCRDKVRVLRQNNSGVSMARLAGIQAAHGEWIGFVDADDEIEKDMYERLLKNAIKYHAQISHCGYQTIVNGGERVHFFYNSGMIRKQCGIDGLRDLLEGRYVEPGLWNKLYQRSLIECVLKEDTSFLSLKYNEDLLLNYLFFQKAECAIFEDFCPYHYMARPQSATRKKFDAAKRSDPVKVWNRIMQEVPSDLKDIALHRYLLSCFSAYTGFLYAGYDKDTCERYKNELIKYKKKWGILRKPDRLRLELIMRSPALYRIAQDYYVRVFQKKRYE